MSPEYLADPDAFSSASKARTGALKRGSPGGSGAADAGIGAPAAESTLSISCG
jgi:hypothetical protein